MITRSWVTCLVIGIFLIFCVCPCFGEETSNNETKAEEKSSPQVQQTEASKEGTTQQDSIQPSASAPTTSSSTPEGQEKKRELRLQALKTLMNQDFRYSLVAAIGNPFVPFVQPPQQKASPTELAEGAPPPPVILTPLQKMEIGEIERGFKGVLWTANERKALIEDPTGKGYIVGVGTPIGNQDGVITAIFQDRIVIRQKVWDKTARTFKDEDLVVKLRKKPEGVEE